MRAEGTYYARNRERLLAKANARYASMAEERQPSPPRPKKSDTQRKAIRNARKRARRAESVLLNPKPQLTVEEKRQRKRDSWLRSYHKLKPPPKAKPYKPSRPPKPPKPPKRTAEEKAARQRAWRAANPGYAAEWYRANPEKFAAWNRNRKARERGAEGRHTAAETRSLFERQGGRCTCGVKLNARNRHLDHITALANGGSNGIRNLQWLCAPCNINKGAKCPIAWAQENGRLV